jgi:hypothetical protein
MGQATDMSPRPWRCPEGLHSWLAFMAHFPAPGVWLHAPPAGPCGFSFIYNLDKQLNAFPLLSIGWFFEYWSPLQLIVTDCSLFRISWQQIWTSVQVCGLAARPTVASPKFSPNKSAKNDK